MNSFGRGFPSFWISSIFTIGACVAVCRVKPSFAAICCLMTCREKSDCNRCRCFAVLLPVALTVGAARCMAVYRAAFVYMIDGSYSVAVSTDRTKATYYCLKAV